jgi:hypothetical protein
MIHVIPIDDIREHEDYDCWCDPLVNWLGEDGVPYINGALVTHNSADGREKLEEQGIKTGKQWGVFECTL